MLLKGKWFLFFIKIRDYILSMKKQRILCLNLSSLFLLFCHSVTYSYKENSSEKNVFEARQLAKSHLPLSSRLLVIQILIWRCWHIVSKTIVLKRRKPSFANATVYVVVFLATELVYLLWENLLVRFFFLSKDNTSHYIAIYVFLFIFSESETVTNQTGTFFHLDILLWLHLFYLRDLINSFANRWCLLKL